MRSLLFVRKVIALLGEDWLPALSTVIPLHDPNLRFALDFWVQSNGNLINPQFLDRLFQLNAARVDLQPLTRQITCNVTP
mgnify:CR=1 FL=1